MSDTLSEEALANLAEMRAAAEAEPDHDEADAEENGEPGNVAAPPQPSDREMETIGKKLDAEATRHEKRVAEIMGPQMADLAPCPLCITPGFVTSLAPPDFDPMQRLAVLTAMGEPAAPELKQHPDLYECPTCGGLGDLLTGSRKDTTRAEGCPDCGGKGYRNRQYEAAMSNVAHFPSAPQAPPPPPAGAAVNGANPPGTVTQGGYSFQLVPGAQVDPSGRLAGHPLWGADASAGGV